MPERRPSDGADTGAVGVAGRRRVIDLALTRRPDMDLDELHGVLGRLGIAVDDATLLADLDALGFEVDEPPAGGAAPAAGPAPGSGPGGGDDESRLRRYAPIAVALVVALVVLVGAVWLLGRGGDDDGPSYGAGSQPVPLDDASTTTTTEAPATAPLGPGPDPALVEPDLAFDFDDDAPGLEPLPDGAEWDVSGGSFTVAGGDATSSAPVSAPVLATFQMASPDGRVQVTLPRADEGAALAFRRDGDTWFAWAVEPGRSTVVLYQVTGSQVTEVLDSGTTEISEGMTIGINVIGTGAELLANGAVVASYDQVGEGFGVGVAAMTEGVPARFDDLLVQYR